MFSIIEKCGIVPVIKIKDASKAVPLARALLAGGVGVIEITFRTDAAPDAIAAIAEQVPEMLVGAGTVLTAKQLSDAKQAGARFVVAPGFDADIVTRAQSAGMPIVPGVVTPTEVSAVLKLGLSVVKFFPAESFGGASTVKALAAPFAGLRFIPTGGIGEGNVSQYWKLSQVLAVGGTWMAPERLIDENDFAQIEKMTAEAVRLREDVRRA